MAGVFYFYNIHTITKPYRKLVRTLSSIIAPPICISCIADTCIEGMPLCWTCMAMAGSTNHFNNPNNDLVRRLTGRVELVHAGALFTFVKCGPVQKMIHGLKYKHQHRAGYQLGRLAGQKILNSKIMNAPDVIIPIPIHNSKRIVRGYNQSEVFAEGIKAILDVPVLKSILIKKTPGRSQTTQTRSGRMENVMNTFQLNNQESIEGKSVLVVDDVVTTGATIEATAHKLLQNCDINLNICVIALAYD